eukprot:scaffold3677_cov206-Amphora_coffeaeformis.AAC.1
MTTRRSSSQQEDDTSSKRARILDAETKDEDKEKEEERKETKQEMIARLRGITNNFEFPEEEDEEEEFPESAFNMFYNVLANDGEPSFSRIEPLIDLLKRNESLILEQCCKHEDEDLQEWFPKISSLHDLLPIMAAEVYKLQVQAEMSDCRNDYRVAQQSMRYDPPSTLDLALSYFPSHPSCRALAAHWGRVTGTLPDDVVLAWYERAANDAATIRNMTLTMLSQEESPQPKEEGEEEKNDAEEDLFSMSTSGNAIHAWLEKLIFHQVLDVEYLSEDEFSASAVEGTSRYMAAILASRSQQHEAALSHLQSLGIQYRLHPHVWQTQTANTNTAQSTPTRPPVSISNVLPKHLYQRMCQVFGPNANFWHETGYKTAGYFSFFSDLPSSPEAVRHLIDDVVVNYLLPCVHKFLDTTKNEHDDDGHFSNEIMAYEWWAHSRARTTSLGHALHFDTDEAQLAEGETANHPIVSSVFHLTGRANTVAPTIVLDQSPTSTSLPSVCWQSVPEPNSFMMFPGDLLHGVLPSPPVLAKTTVVAAAAGTAANTETSSSRWISPSDDDDDDYRLTFMVGFKTRIVPDQRKDRFGSYYGPCAPLPPPRKQRWVREIYKGYETADENRKIPVDKTTDIVMNELPRATPVWQAIPPGKVREDPTPPLPSGIDQRFFLKESSPLEYFRSTLHEPDDPESDNDV